ncbi:hypothetical protein [Streptodolium elevatio]
MGQRAVRATAAAVTVVTVVTALAGCGRLETRRHAFPDSLYEPTPSTGASATPSATPSAAAGTGNPPAATAPRATTPGTGTGAPGEPYADLTAAQLLQKAEEAAAEVRTVRVVAAFFEDGEQSSLDLRYDLDTADVVGSIEAEGHTVEILRRGDDSWFKAEAAYWRASGAPADTARQIGGKYLHVSSDHKAFGEFEQLAGIADPGSVLEALTKPRRQAPVAAAGGTQIPVAGYTGGRLHRRRPDDGVPLGRARAGPGPRRRPGIGERGRLPRDRQAAGRADPAVEPGRRHRGTLGRRTAPHGVARACPGRPEPHRAQNEGYTQYAARTPGVP